MVRFENVTIHEGDKHILNSISFEIIERDRAVLYGRSGSGKSSVLLAVLGAYIPVGGAIYFRGKAIDKDHINQVRQSVSYIGQEPQLGAETVEQAIYLPFTYKTNRNKKPDHETVLRYMKKLHLDKTILGKQVSVISGGEKQRIAVLRGLLQNKSIFLLDEITSALDEESKNVVIELFREEKFTFISVSHDSRWMDICTRFFHVHEGRIEETEKPVDFSKVIKKE